jgi:diaminopimelate epimerase
LVLICPSDKADFKMRMFNSDGSESEMCGNAIRCVGKYVFDNKLTVKTNVTIETLAGIKVLDLRIKNELVEQVRVDMGEPVLKGELIPVNISADKVIKVPVNILDKTFYFTAVSMGNPHAVSYIDDVDGFDLHKYGPVMEKNELFPRRVNAEFVQVIDKSTLKMRVWERGAGETLACGTGACAVLVASVLNGLVERAATIKLLGGDLHIEWDEKDNHVYMTGPAVKVFEGEINI